MEVAELARTLAKLKLTVTAAESLTGGTFQNKICSCENAAEVYPGGFIAYSTEAKARLLDIPGRLLKKSGAVNEHTAMAMAKACRNALEADLGLSFTGVGGPEPSDGLEPGTVWIGVADCDSAFARRFVFSGNPEDIIDQAVRTAAGMLGTYALDNRDRLTCRR